MWYRLALMGTTRPNSSLLEPALPLRLTCRSCFAALLKGRYIPCRLFTSIRSHLNFLPVLILAHSFVIYSSCSVYLSSDCPCQFAAFWGKEQRSRRRRCSGHRHERPGYGHEQWGRDPLRCGNHNKYDGASCRLVNALRM